MQLQTADSKSAQKSMHVNDSLNSDMRCVRACPQWIILITNKALQDYKACVALTFGSVTGSLVMPPARDIRFCLNFSLSLGNWWLSTGKLLHRMPCRAGIPVIWFDLR